MKIASLILTHFFFNAVALYPSSYEKAAETIRSNLPKAKATATDSLCSTFPCCNVSSTQSCPYSSMIGKKSTLVLPGGDTRCIYSYSTPFGFQVIPGDTNNLLIYFEAGGACWSYDTTVTNPLCYTSISPTSTYNGIFNRSSLENKFRNYTIVYALYCSGDTWAGNVTRSYKDSNGGTISQQGYTNAKVTIDWIIQQQKLGSFPSEFNNLLFMGGSAGSMGIQMWATNLVNQFKAKHMAVVADSYLCVFPNGTQGPLIEGMGVCNVNWHWMNPTLSKECKSKQITMQMIMEASFPSTPTIPYIYIQSKEDQVQMAFYQAVAVTSMVDPTLTPAQFYNDANLVFEAYNVYPNTIIYMVDGSQHEFTPFDLYYTADALGPDNNGQNYTGPELVDWINTLPLSASQSIKSICSGPAEIPPTSIVLPTLLNRFKETNTGTLRGMNLQHGRNLQNDTLDYCDTKLYPKVFVQS